MSLLITQCISLSQDSCAFKITKRTSYHQLTELEQDQGSLIGLLHFPSLKNAEIGLN